MASYRFAQWNRRQVVVPSLIEVSRASEYRSKRSGIVVTSMAQIAIVGGGIIGCAAATWLAADGHNVTVFERAPAEKPASAGNAGVIATADVLPLATPGIIRSVPGWLLDPLGPLALRIRDLTTLSPYLMRFLASARENRVRQATAALGTLLGSALADHRELARRSGMARHMRRTGSLHLINGDRVYRSELPNWEIRRQHGIPFDEITPDETREMAPCLSGAFTHAFFTPDVWMVSSPAAVLEALRRRLRSEAAFDKRDVIGLRGDTHDVSIITAEGADLPFDRVIVAAGIWSRDLVRNLGLKVSLEAQRGYNTTFPHDPLDLPFPVAFSQHGFYASPLAEGLRVGGAVELARPDAPPNYKRAEAMLKVMQRYAPDLPLEGGTTWMGCRPSTPDSLPVIGRDPDDPRIVFAFGHGHLGLTLSAVTARHVTALINGESPADLAPFGIERFQ